MTFPHGLGATSTATDVDGLLGMRIECCELLVPKTYFLKQDHALLSGHWLVDCMHGAGREADRNAVS